MRSFAIVEVPSPLPALYANLTEKKKRKNELPAVLWGWSGRWRAPLDGKLLRFPPSKEHTRRKENKLSKTQFNRIKLLNTNILMLKPDHDTLTLALALSPQLTFSSLGWFFKRDCGTFGSTWKSSKCVDQFWPFQPFIILVVIIIIIFFRSVYQFWRSRLTLERVFMINAVCKFMLWLIIWKPYCLLLTLFDTLILLAFDFYGQILAALLMAALLSFCAAFLF